MELRKIFDTIPERFDRWRPRYSQELFDHLIREAGIPVTRVNKLYEGRPNVSDMITNGDIDLVINSPVGKDSVHDDSYLRKAAIKARIPYITTIAAAMATADGIKYVKTHDAGEIKSLQALHEEIH